MNGENRLKNIPASVRHRLYNLSKVRKEEFEYVLTRFALERFLYRLGRSAHNKRFVLKGAMLFQVWSPGTHRMTRDLDLLDSRGHEAKKVVQAVREVLGLKVADDGLVFDGKSLKWEPIREGQTYHGVRLHFKAKLTTAVIPLQVDVGFGDLIDPKPRLTRYPTLLDSPSPNVLAYAKETVVAEKLHAMVVHGMVNSRLKDYYDIWFLLRHFHFSKTRLSKAVRATFGRRKSELPGEWPVALSEEFFNDARANTQWNAFWKKAALPGKALELKKVIKEIRKFLEPVLGI